MQVDAESFHGRERHRQHQRNRQRHDQTGAQAEREKTHQQHDQHGCGERVHKFADGTRDRTRLVGDAIQFEADRQSRAQARDRGVEIVTERDDVAAVAHRHRDAERIAAHIAHARLLRIGIAAPYLGDVAETEQMAVGADCDVADRVHRIERAGRAQIDAVAGSFETARCGNRVLRHQYFLHLVEGHAQRGEFGIRQFDIYFFVLTADQLNLGDVGYVQQFELDALGVIAQLRIAVAVAAERVDVAEGVAELVVEERALNAGRQGGANIADLLAHLIEYVGHARGRHRILDHHKHLRFAWSRIAAQVVQFRDFLQFLLDLIGDLLGHFGGGCARPPRLHQHHLERERRIFGLAQAQVRPHPEHRQHDDEVAQQRTIAQGPGGKVEAGHGFFFALVFSCASGRGRNKCLATPSVIRGREAAGGGRGG